MNFDEARALLARCTDRRMAQAVAMISALADRADRRVSQMRFKERSTLGEVVKATRGVMMKYWILQTSDEAI